MSSSEQIINQAIVRSMREGVFTLDKTGHITSVNPAAQEILGIGQDAVGQTLVTVFFDSGTGENDEFCEAILSAVWGNAVMHNAVVNYRRAADTRQLFMSTSYLKDGDETLGMTVVINDITELNELRDAVRAMEKIRALNAELEKRNAFIKKTFGRYLSDEIVSSLLETRDGLEIGGRKQDVTVMFTDIRGFTALSEIMPPSDLIAMLNHYLGRMIDVIMAHRGTILEFIGDAIVAVFGAPLESDTRSRDAVTSAVLMQRDMAAVNEWNEAHGYPALEMGIGIHCGDVVLGNIGSDRKAKYDIIGRHVNLASRIETYTVGGQILVSGDVAREVGSSLTVGRQLEVMPKGVREPVRVYEVCAIDGISMPDATQHFVPVEPPLSVLCFPLEGKHTSSAGFPGLIRAVSEKEFLLDCAEALPVSSTVSLTAAGDELYAKVTGTRDGCLLLHLTSGKTRSIRAAAEARA